MRNVVYAVLSNDIDELFACLPYTVVGDVVLELAGFR